MRETDAKAGLNAAIGGRGLYAWQPVRGVVWVQTRDAWHARRMATQAVGGAVKCKPCLKSAFSR